MGQKGVWEEGAGDSLSPNASVYIWTPVKFSIPLAILYPALQHYSSGQGFITTVIFSSSSMLKIPPYYYTEPKKFTADTRSSMNKKAN